MSNTIINNPIATLEEKLDACITCNTSSTLRHLKNLPISILWRLWKSRNTLVFSQKHIQWWVLLRQTKSDAAEWRNVEANKEMQTHREGSYATNSSNRKWKKPGDGWIKFNLDGSFSSSTRIGKAGWVVRDDHGALEEQDRQ